MAEVFVNPMMPVGEWRWVPVDCIVQRDPNRPVTAWWDERVQAEYRRQNREWMESRWGKQMNASDRRNLEDAIREFDKISKHAQHFEHFAQSLEGTRNVQWHSYFDEALRYATVEDRSRIAAALLPIIHEIAARESKRLADLDIPTSGMPERKLPPILQGY